MSRAQKTCAQCGEVFSRNKSFGAEQWEAARFCSRKCAGSSLSKTLAERRPALAEKFNSFFDRTAGCWEWKGTIEGYGYGVMDHASKRYRAHVLALEFDGRPVPAGMVARHHCDNPRCVKPDHLCVGTIKENVNDAVNRGRIARGERNSNARLTSSDVLSMRGFPGSFTEIAEKFGVSRPTVTRAIKGLTWRHLP